MVERFLHRFCVCSVLYPEFFGRASSLFTLVSHWDATMVGNKVKISWVFLVYFLHVFSATFFVIKLVIFVVAYISPRSQGTENLASEFSGWVRRKLLGILLVFNQFIFSQPKRQTNKISIKSIFPPVTIPNWNR